MSSRAGERGRIGDRQGLTGGFYRAVDGLPERASPDSAGNGNAGGIFGRWKSSKGDELRTFTIITTEPNELVRPMHDRMPAIIKPEDFGGWLDRGVTDPDAVTPMLAPLPADQMEAYRVGTRVNKPGQDGPECIAPAEAPEPEQRGLFG